MEPGRILCRERFGPLLRRVLMEDGASRDAAFGKLSQSLSALYSFRPWENVGWTASLLARRDWGCEGYGITNLSDIGISLAPSSLFILSPFQLSGFWVQSSRATLLRKTCGGWAFAELCDVYEIESDFEAKVAAEFEKLIDSTLATLTAS